MECLIIQTNFLINNQAFNARLKVFQQLIAAFQDTQICRKSNLANNWNYGKSLIFGSTTNTQPTNRLGLPGIISYTIGKRECFTKCLMIHSIEGMQRNCKVIDPKKSWVFIIKKILSPPLYEISPSKRR